MATEFKVATSADIPEIHAITRRAYSVWLPVLGYPPQPMTDDHAPRIERGEVLVAYEAGKVSGLIVVEPGKDHDLIFSVAADPDCAGNGIGTRLIAEAERRARLAGKTCMKLYTNAFMTRNIAFYLKRGYCECGRRPNAARPGFTIVDMAKRLTGSTQPP